MAIKLKIGLSDCDRVRPIADGSAPIAGVEADVTFMGVQALFNQQLTEHTFDCCEFPLATYLRTLETPERPYAAVPIFPSRHFRHSCVFVNSTKGIHVPADLAGRRIGVPVFDMAAAVWLRGIFQDHHDLPRTAPIYVAGGLEAPRAIDEHPQFYPSHFTHEKRGDASLAALLQAGEIDALYTARAPSTWPSETVTRLFDDPMPVEQAYFSRTGIFPPMHVIAIKRSLVEAHEGLALAIFNAFAHAQDIARAKLFDSAALATMLPWQLESLRSVEHQLGPDYWSTGFAKNRTMLGVIIRYLCEDGLVTTGLKPEHLFTGSDILAT